MFARYAGNNETKNVEWENIKNELVGNVKKFLEITDKMCERIMQKKEVSTNYANFILLMILYEICFIH